MGRGALPALLLLSAAAALLRLVAPDSRPMHADEAIHAVRLADLLHSGRYVYDPHDYHGPTIYYATLPLMRVLGVHDLRQMDEWMLRSVTAAFGVALILLLGLAVDGLGRAAALWAAALSAVQPALVYYSRYYIQETLLVAFTFLLLVAGWRWWRTRRVVWALVAGSAAGLMHATKETCVVVWAALLGALCILVWLQRRSARRSSRGRPFAVALLLATLTAAIVSITAFSVFFQHAGGPLDSVRAFVQYVGRAGGEATEHVQPWWYYAWRMLLAAPDGNVSAWLLALLVFAVIGATTCWRTADASLPALALRRLLALYGLLLAVAYSVIPYKTPWSFLGVVHIVAVLAGCGIADVLRFAASRPRSRRAVVGIAALAGLAVTGGLAHSAYSASVSRPAAPQNPYTCGQTVPDVRRLADYVHGLAAAGEGGHPLIIAVIAENPWPLPWTLRRLPHVGYWTPAQSAAALALEPPIVIAEAPSAADAMADPIAAALAAQYVGYHYGLRPESVLRVYARTDLWERFAESQGSTP